MIVPGLLIVPVLLIVPGLCFTVCTLAWCMMASFVPSACVYAFAWSVLLILLPVVLYLTRSRNLKRSLSYLAEAREKGAPMVNSDLIQKSVRLPVDLVDYIESCSGSTFTEKLVGILEDYRDGLTARTLELKRLRERQNSVSQQLQKLQSISRRSYEVFRGTEMMVDRVRDLNDYIRSVLEDPG